MNNFDDEDQPFINSSEIHEKELQDKNPKERAQWSSSLEFILTIVSFAIGLGNVWRFPYLVFKHGGAPFLIPFIILLLVVGIPLFLLETAVGQFSGLSPTDSFARMCPLLKGLGYSAALVNFFIGLYYNVIIAYCMYYLFVSIRSEVPWKHCVHGVRDCFVRDGSEINNVTCVAEKAQLLAKNITKTRSPSEVYFYDTVLELTSGIDNLGGLNWHLSLCLILAWLIVFFALLKGVKSLGKVSYFTATFPYLMLTALIIMGFQLDGSDKGIEFYIGKFDISRILNARLWMDACVQIIFALSACNGGLVSMSSFSKFDNNVMRDALLVPILDIFTGFYAGFALFTVLGNMYVSKCVKSFAEVAAQGPELAFIVYPDGLSLTGKAAPFFSFLFFAMMLLLGLGSEFGTVESTITAVIDVLKNKIFTDKDVIKIRMIICSIFCGLGLFMTTKGGFFILNLIDNYIAGYPLLIVGFTEVVLVAWIYGADQFCRDIECMIGKRSSYFWTCWKICWRFICPSVILSLIIITIYWREEEMNVNGILYPESAKIFGNLLLFVTLSPIPLFAIYQLINHDFDLLVLMKPDESYYNNYKQFLHAKPGP